LIELARIHLNDVIIPDLIAKSPNGNNSQKIILDRYNHQNDGPGKKVPESTAWHWLVAMTWVSI
jgi:hypothetical protein